MAAPNHTYSSCLILPKTRVNVVPISEDSIILCSCMLTQYWHVMDGRTNEQTEMV